MGQRRPEQLRNAEYRILRLVSENPSITQRELAEAAGVSLGKLNYCVKALIDRGLLKIGNFRRSSSKLDYAYLLTPTGLFHKTALAADFLKIKMEEYERLKKEIRSLQLDAVPQRRLTKRAVRNKD